MTKRDIDTPTAHEQELLRAADEVERHRDDDLGQAVPGAASKTVRNTFSLKLGAEELDEIADAAEAAGVSVGAFIREAALRRARHHQGAALRKVRRQVKELAETVNQL